MKEFVLIASAVISLVAMGVVLILSLEVRRYLLKVEAALREQESNKSQQV